MEFRDFFETQNQRLGQIAAAIGKQYQSSQEDLAAVFDRLAKGLNQAEESELEQLVIGLVRAGQIKLKPGAYNRELQPYAPPPPQPQFTPQEQQALGSLFVSAQKKFIPWLKEFYKDEPDELRKLTDAERFSALQDFLYDTYSIRVREDGLITFDALGRAVERIIGDLPVAVYHHTTTALDRIIKRHGLQGHGYPGVKKVNPHANSGAGVYVTTETSGPAVKGYFAQAIATYGGNQRTWTIRTTLNKLMPDPDDADISSGRHQFVLPYVSPSDLVEAD